MSFVCIRMTQVSVFQISKTKLACTVNNSPNYLRALDKRKSDRLPSTLAKTMQNHDYNMQTCSI